MQTVQSHPDGLFLQYFDTVGWVFWPVTLSPI